jgi:hypothetical protein
MFKKIKKKNVFYFEKNKTRYFSKSMFMYFMSTLAGAHAWRLNEPWRVPAYTHTHTHTHTGGDQMDYPGEADKDKSWRWHALTSPHIVGLFCP